MYAGDCMHTCVSVSPKSIFARTNRCLASLLCSRGQAPSFFPQSTSPFSPLLSFHEHLFSSHGGDTCIPAVSQRNQVTSQTGCHYNGSCKQAGFPLNTHSGEQRRMHLHNVDAKCIRLLIWFLSVKSRHTHHHPPPPSATHTHVNRQISKRKSRQESSAHPHFSLPLARCFFSYQIPEKMTYGGGQV